MWKVSRNLPNHEIKEFNYFTDAVKEARRLCNSTAEVVLSNGRETYVLRKLLD